MNSSITRKAFIAMLNTFVRQMEGVIDAWNAIERMNHICADVEAQIFSNNSDRYHDGSVTTTDYNILLRGQKVGYVRVRETHEYREEREVFVSFTELSPREWRERKASQRAAARRHQEAYDASREVVAAALAAGQSVRVQDGQKGGVFVIGDHRVAAVRLLTSAYFGFSEEEANRRLGEAWYKGSDSWGGFTFTLNPELAHRQFGRPTSIEWEMTA